MRVVAGDDDMFEVIAVPDRVGEFGVERFGDDQQPRPRILEHEAVIGLGHQRVDRNRDDAGLDGAEKSGRPIDGVEEADQNALLAADAERAQHMAEALDPLGKLGIGVLAAVIDIGEFVAAAGVEIALEDIGGEIVVARDGGFRRRIAHRGVSSSARAFAHPLPTTKHYADVKIRRQWRCRPALSLPVKLRYDKAASSPAGVPIMLLSRDRILTTHVGSLPRNETLSDLLVKQEDGEKLDPAMLADEMDKAVRHVVAKQMEAGIDVGNDGEQRRIGFQTYVPQRMSGFAGVSKRRRGREFEEFPELISYLMRRFPNPPKSQHGAPEAQAEHQISRSQTDQRRDRGLQAHRRRAARLFRAVHDRGLARHHFDHDAQRLLPVA